MGYVIQKIRVGTQQVRPPIQQTVQTFDFQNDGNLGWTANTLYGTPTYVSWEWWTLTAGINTDTQSTITPPNTIYNNGTLSRVKIWFYKWVVDSWLPSQWVWTWSASANQFIQRSQSGTRTSQIMYYNYNGGGSTTLGTSGADSVGEHVLTFDFWANVFVNIDGVTYTMWGWSSVFTSLWSNQALCLTLWNWRNAEDFYLRKCEITTLD